MLLCSQACMSVYMYCTHIHTNPLIARRLAEKVYHYTLSHERALKVIYKYITPKLDTIEIRNTVQQLSENEEKENTGEMILYGRDLSASQLIS